MAKLTSKQKSIIKNRADKGLALNLSAMLRVHPEIVEASFECKEIFGWRRTLLDLSIDPYGIVHDLANEVECLICGNHYKLLPSHLINKHSYTSDDYLEEFGIWAELSSDTFRARIFQGKGLEELQHWEKLWSPYYIIDYVSALNEFGVPCNAEFIRTNIGLLTVTSRYFESWDSMLCSARVVGARVNNVEKKWNKHEIIVSLKQFVKMRQEGYRGKMPGILLGAIVRYYGSVEKACKAAKINPDDFRMVHFITESEVNHIVDLIRKLEPLRGKERRDKMEQIAGKYYKVIATKFGSLFKLAKANNIPDFLVGTFIYRSEEDVVHDLMLIKENGGILSQKDIAAFSSALYLVIIKKGWGRHLLEKRPVPLLFPKCNPKSGLLRDALLLWRKRCKLSTIEAASLIGVTRQRYLRIERGQNKPREEELRKIKTFIE